MACLLPKHAIKTAASFDFLGISTNFGCKLATQLKRVDRCQSGRGSSNNKGTKNWKNLIKIPKSRRADFQLLLLLFAWNLLFVAAVIVVVCLKIGLIAKGFWRGTHSHTHTNGGGNWWQASTRRCPHATVVKSQQKDNSNKNTTTTMEF